MIQDCQEIIEAKKRKIPKKYLTKDPETMRYEIEKHAEKSDDDPSAYKSHPEGDWQADYSKETGERWKTKKSKHTSKFEKRFGLKKEDIDLESFFGQEIDILTEVLLFEAISEKIKKAVKKKAKLANAPYGVLMKVLKKGMAAWKTGHRPGVNQIQWALGRVNSFLTGGPARRIDKKEWQEVQRWRKK